MTPDTEPLRILVIGAGPAAVAMHLPALARIRDRRAIVLAIICDLDTARADDAQRRFGFLEKSGDAFASIARTDIDAVYVFGSAKLHFECAMQALRRRKHVFVEKPIAPSYEEALLVAQLAAENGLIAAGGHNRRFYQSMAFVRAQAPPSSWRFAEAAFHKPEFGKMPLFGARTWLSANGIHALDALLFMMGGLPRDITAFSTATASGRGTYCAAMRWPNGAQAVFACHNDAGSRRETYAFHGLTETYNITDAGVSIEKNDSVQVRAMPAVGDGIDAEHAAFLDAIGARSQPVHAFATLAPSLFLAELIENGFSGPVLLPRMSTVRKSTVAAARSVGVLVASPGDLQPSLNELVGRHRLISIDEVDQAPAERPDIEAAILGRNAKPLLPALLEKLPRLAVVGIQGLSMARFAPDTLFARNIRICNASNTYAESVAELALALSILARRRAFTSHEIMRNNGWGVIAAPRGIYAGLRRAAKRCLPLLRACGLEPWAMRIRRNADTWTKSAPRAAGGPAMLAGARVGLLGWSANARAFAHRLRDAGARVSVYSQHANEAEIFDCGAVPASLTDVLANDIVSLHRGLTPATRHGIGRLELQQLRPGSTLINLARGALIEPAALLERLQRGDVFACLDTYEYEPLPARHPLRRLPNVFLTSHIGGGSADMHAAAAAEVIAKVTGYFDGKGIEAITEQRLRTMS